MRRPTCVLFGLPILLTLPGAAFCQPAPAERRDPETLCRFAVQSFVEQWNRIPFYSCRFTLTGARAESVRDARNGTWTDAVVQSHGRVVRRGEQVCREQFWATLPKPIGAATGFRRGSRPSVLYRYFELSDGAHRLCYGPPYDVELIHSEDAYPNGLPEPLELLSGGGECLHWSLDRMLHSPDLYSFEPVGPAKWDGRPAVLLRFKWNSLDRLDEFWLDPAAGYLPVRRTSRTKTAGRLWLDELIAAEVRACPGQRWFPTRVVRISTPSPTSRCWVQETKVTELDTEHQPADDEFAVTLSNQTRYLSKRDPDRQMKPSAERIVRVQDLPALFHEVEETPQDWPPADAPPLPFEGPSAWWAAGGVAVVLGLLAVMRIRARRGRRAGKLERTG